MATEQLYHHPERPEISTVAHGIKQHEAGDGGDGIGGLVTANDSRSEPADSEEDVETDTRMEDESEFEFSADISKDLLSLNEELSNILDPKVHINAYK